MARALLGSVAAIKEAHSQRRLSASMSVVEFNFVPARKRTSPSTSLQAVVEHISGDVAARGIEVAPPARWRKVRSSSKEGLCYPGIPLQDA
jgi:hypothetical protein